MASGVLVLLVVFVTLTLAPGGARAEFLRIAVYNAALSRDAPGLLLRDIRRGTPQTEAAAAMIRALDADILLLTGFDQDLRNLALGAFLARLREGKDGIDYPHIFSPPGNNGLASLSDLDGNDRRTGWGDGWGWGKFPGHSGMALVSRLPIDEDAARTFRLLLWGALPGANLPEDAEGNPWPDAETRAAMRLSSRGHWDVPVILPDGSRLHLLAAYPTPPVFDGPEGRNLRRNHDEIDFWRQYLDGWAAPDDAGLSAAAPVVPVILIGSLNADPEDGDGRRVAVQRLLAHDRLRDTAPASEGGVAAAARQGGVNRHHLGDPALDTADWRDEDGPGNLRVDYVLPDARLAVHAAGVLWPAPDGALAEVAETASAHRPVWVDLELPTRDGGLDRVATER